jgi:hypothetical protein
MGGMRGDVKLESYEKWRYRHIDGVGDDIEIGFVDPSASGEYRQDSGDVFQRMSQYFENKNLPDSSPSLLFDVNTEYILRSTSRVLVRIMIGIRSKDLKSENDQGVERTLVNYYGIAKSPAGHVIAEWEEVDSAEHGELELPQGEDGQTKYQHIIALSPGRQFKLNVIVEDLIGKKRGAVVLDLNVP